MEAEVDRRTRGNIHQGNNVKRFRRLFGFSQEQLAEKLNMTPSNLSKIEKKELIDNDMLGKMAKELNLPIEILRDLSDEAAMNFISNSFENMGTGIYGMSNTNHVEGCTFVPVETIFKIFTEKEQLLRDKLELTEELLRAEREKNKSFKP